MRIFSLIALVSLIFVSCQTQESKNDPFLVTKNSVGQLKKTTEMRELDSIYSQDSIVSNSDEMLIENNQISILDTDGHQLLILDPVTAFDSTSTVASVQLKDKRFKTDKGLGVNSTFKTVSKNYKIKRIENTLSNAVIFLKNHNIYLAIEKENISGDGKFDTGSKIEPTQIPDDAPIKYLWIDWK